MKVRVLETNVLHVSDSLVWLDGSSGSPAQSDGMRRVEVPLSVTLTTRPRDLQWLRKPGRLALWRKPTSEIVPGTAGEAQRTRPAGAPFRVAGLVDDPSGRFNPGAFDLDVGDGAGHPILLYPSPEGTRMGTGGGLEGCLRYEQPGNEALDGRPVPWANLSVTVTISPGDAETPPQHRVFSAQSDGKGDFRLAFHRLPPLPDGVDLYPGILAVTAETTAHPGLPPVSSDLDAMRLGALGEPFSFGATVSLDIVPGRVLSVRSFNRNHLAVRPA